MHGTHNAAGSIRRDGHVDSDPGADFDPDDYPDSGPVPLGVAVYRDAYWRALSDALRDGNPDALGVAHRDAYNECVRLQRAAVLRRTFRGRARSAVCRARALLAAPRGGARRSTATPPVML